MTHARAFVEIHLRYFLGRCFLAVIDIVFSSKPNGWEAETSSAVLKGWRHLVICGTDSGLYDEYSDSCLQLPPVVQSYHLDVHTLDVLLHSVESTLHTATIFIHPDLYNCRIRFSSFETTEYLKVLCQILLKLHNFDVEANLIPDIFQSMMKSIEKPSPNQSWKIENLGQSPAHLLLMLRYEKGQRGAQAQLLIATPHSNCNRPEPQSGEKQWLIALPLDPHHQKTERTNYRSWKKYGLAGNHYLDLSFCWTGVYNYWLSR